MSDSKLRFAAKVLPSGYQMVSEEAINWLYENYPEAYQGFYERVSGLTQRAADGATPSEEVDPVIKAVNGMLDACVQPPRR